ncbi:saccharopine dehydrogenase NADP-binding domain-containing protein [Candidatus Pacearchaeota archaeon]|nr:saccharopine dehydrogenase NADP-binding domain-containing protein [Candidatus Pacearchaeota archaeon]
MKYDFAVFGATGLQGKIVTKDLVMNGYSVLICGRDKSRVEDLLKKYSKKTGFNFIDARSVSQMESVIKKSGANIVVNCVEKIWNLNVLKACVKARVNSIDLGSDVWMTKKQLAMNSELKRENLIHITGCGSVPGIGNVMLRYTAEKFDTIHTANSGYNWKSNMKRFVVPFSIQSVIEEFTEKATIITDGKLKDVNPMDSITMCSQKAIGKQNCFNEKHPESYTFYHYFRDKGLKESRTFAGFPKHSYDIIKMLIELGLGSKEPIDFHGAKIKPIEFLTEVLKKIKVPSGYKETENLWVDVYGREKGKNKHVKMECVIHTLSGWEDDYTNIDTGMPCSIIAQMIKAGLIKEKGSFSPEGVVPTEYFFKELAKRKMRVYENGKLIN